MKTKLSVILAFLLASTMMLSACQSGGDSTSQATNQASSASEAKSTASEPSADSSAQDTKLTITWWGSQTRHEYTQELLDTYSEQTGVTFEATPSGWDGYFDKLSTQAAGGTLPDIMQMDYLYISTFAGNNTLADLQPFVDSSVLDLSDVDQNMTAAGKIGDALAGIVLSSSILTIPYNPDVLAEAGIAEPTPDWTWDDLIQNSLTIKEKIGKYGLSSQIDDANLFNYWVRQHGKPLFSADNKSLGYDDDAIFAGYAAMIKQLSDAGAMPNPDEWDQLKTLGKEARPVATGDGAYIVEWNNYAVIVEDTNPDLKLVTPPYNANGTKALWVKPGMFFSVAETSQNKEESAKFISWFINDEGANDIIMAERGVPVSAKIRDYLSPKMSLKQQEMMQYVNVALEHATTLPPPDPQGIGEINQLLVDTLARVMYDQLTPDEAAAAFRSDANSILARNN